MAETLTLRAVLGAHLPTIYPALIECDCGWSLEAKSEAYDERLLPIWQTHQVDAVRAWLMGQRDVVAEYLRVRHMADDDCGAWSTNSCDVCFNDGPDAKTLADAVLGALTKADQ